MSGFAETRSPWKTYRRADGDLICGDYAFMTEPDIFENDDSGEDYFEVIEETWQLVESRTLKFGSTSRWCVKCDEDVTLPEPRPGLIYCSEHQPPSDIDGER